MSLDLLKHVFMEQKTCGKCLRLEIESDQLDPPALMSLVAVRTGIANSYRLTNCCSYFIVTSKLISIL